MTLEQKPSFGQLFRQVRTEKGLSQAQVGDILGKDRSTISKIETGKIIPPRTPNFYDKFINVPGWGETEISPLLRAAATELWQKYPPKWLTRPA